MLHDESWCGIKKTQLINSEGVTYREFVKTLTPEYKTVWGHIALCHFALLILAVFLYLSSTFQACLIGGVLVGVTLQALHLFMHEGAHYNLAPSRRVNDLIANVFVGCFVGMDIKAYRKSHFEHHRHHGSTMDTEVSYFDALNMTFVACCLLGIQPIKVLRNRTKSGQAKEGAKTSVIVVLFTVLAHAALAGLAAFKGNWCLALAWPFGVFSVFPFLAALRTLLEHRGEHASEDQNYHHIEHGMVNRMFGDGPLASTLGNVGFNRHLLHHWEPQVSYTRLKELEMYLEDTEFQRLLERSRETYIGAFRKLWGK